MFMRRKLNLGDRILNFSIVSWLIVISSLASIVGFILETVSEDYIKYFALKPSSFLRGEYLWTIVTHMFTHASAIHLLINMLILFSLGSLCERIIGRKRFIWFYMIAGLFAGLLSVLLAGFFGNSFIGERIFGRPDIFMVGASGAIFAIAGLYVVLLPRLRFMIIFLPFFSLPAYVMIPIALFGIWIISAIAGWPIGNVAHFGGFLVGMIYGFYLKSKYSRKVKMLQRMFR